MAQVQRSFRSLRMTAHIKGGEPRKGDCTGPGYVSISIRTCMRFSQSGPQMACASAFALRRANLLSILASERVFHGKASFPSLVASAGLRSVLFVCSFVPTGARRQADCSAERHPGFRSRPHSRAQRMVFSWTSGARETLGRSSSGAYQNKVQMRARPNTALATFHITGPAGLSSGSWTPLGPVPLASDATGNGTQDYHQVSGRATAIAIDPADTSGNTIYIGGAQSGVWKSSNAANNTANDVTWTAVTDDQATLSIGAIAVQPGNADVTKTVILAATGEANNSGDSYFGLGILRSVDAGTTWTLVPTANSGALSFSGLGGTRMAFSTASGAMNRVGAAVAPPHRYLLSRSSDAFLCQRTSCRNPVSFQPIH